jgi:hypothetical protein
MVVVRPVIERSGDASFPAAGEGAGGCCCC